MNKLREEKVAELSLELVEMLMRMATSEKKKETYYVSKVSEKLLSLIEESNKEVVEKLQKIVSAWLDVNEWRSDEKELFAVIRKILGSDIQAEIIRRTATRRKEKERIKN